MQTDKTVLRRNLSRLLAQVAAGEELLVTERGRPIARIVPVSDDANALALPLSWSASDRARIRDLVRRGALIWHGGKPQGGPGHAVICGRTMADMAGEDRR